MFIIIKKLHKYIKRTNNIILRKFSKLYMYNYILFTILLILIAASVALIFLILFGESSKRNSPDKSLDKSASEDEYNETEITKNDIELMKKFCHAFSDDEINQFKEIDRKINKQYKKR